MFTHELEWVLGTLVELANTGPGRTHGELLGDLAAVREFSSRLVITEVPAPRRADLAELHKLRTRLRGTITAPDEQTAIRRINELLVAAPIQPRVADHDELGLHIHYFLPGASIAQHLTADLGMALGRLVVDGELPRLKICTAPDCDNVFMDLSRNRSRIYCDSKACGNRLHAAAYRTRRSDVGQRGQRPE